MNSGLSKLQPYPFEKLAKLRARATPNSALELINLSIGEPQHPTPTFIHDALVKNLSGTGKYPATRGLPELRQAISQWASARFSIPQDKLDPDQCVLPVNGTRESLFAIAQCLLAPESGKDIVQMPNPFYQIYEGAALLAGAEPHFFPTQSATPVPNFDAVPDSIWNRTALVYVCSPANPSGHVWDMGDYDRLMAFSDRFGFIVVADECYSELYLDEDQPPPGLLQWCVERGRDDFSNCLVMHSLSKRSNAPGLRSGFVAGDAHLIEAFFRYRTYQGGAMPLPVQHASIAAWGDESHVRENRALYRDKFDAVLPILRQSLDIAPPSAGFYLWPDFGRDDISLCETLLREASVLTLPGQFLAREVAGHNPGAGHLRIALVAPLEPCIAAAERIVNTL